ncbi:hypothetical protein vseg_012009 [Gypsophila vaccaria]
MDFLDDVFSEAPAAKVPAVSKFKPKGKERLKKGSTTAANSVVTNATKEQPAVSVSPSSVQPEVGVKEKPEAPISSSHIETEDVVGLSTTTTERPETAAQDVSSIQNEETPVIPDVSFATSSPFISIQEDSGDLQIDVEQLEAGDFSCLDAVEMMNEAEATSGKRTKLKPKPKAQDRAKDRDETLSPDDEPVIDGSIPGAGPDSIPESLQACLDDKFSLNPTNDQSQSAFVKDTESLMKSDMFEQIDKHGNLDGLNSPDDLPNEDRAFSGVEADENITDFVDGTTGTIHDNGKSPTSAYHELPLNEEENLKGDKVEEEKPKKKRGRKPKNAASENDKPDKPARKRKKVSQEADKPVVKPPKRFPHATRRKRCVDKSLLEVPEEELDLHRLPIKDLILLAEYKEKEMKKQVTPVQPAPTNERIDNLQPEEYPYDDDGLDFDRDRDLDRDLDDIPSTSGVQTDTGYYNYSTHRKKQPRAKWSMKDTEMFYQGIRQFGTDLSMIQQLFPGRSLEQIRSKFRKEQKQNPMMMDDAQSTRATDNSCFELVIKTLEAAREAEEYDYSDDDVAHLTGKEGKAEDTVETHATPQEADNSEQNLKSEADNEKPDMPEVESPVKSDVDDDNWGDYAGL